MVEFKFAKTLSTTPEINQRIMEYFKDEEMNEWIKKDVIFNETILNQVKELAANVRSFATAFVVIGIGGSANGAQALVDALLPYSYNEKVNPKIYFLGSNLSREYYEDVFEKIKNENLVINIISKSGSTFEPNVYFDKLFNFMKDKYSKEELSKRVIVTTGSEGKLFDIANENNFPRLDLAKGIGGRYSVFSPVGLLPAAVAGLNIDEMLKGVENATTDITYSVQYAMLRKKIGKKKTIEAFTVYEPKLVAFQEWLKQLFAESHGKNKKGILPISLLNPRDLHSFEQYLQAGRQNIFETVIFVKQDESYLDKVNTFTKDAAIIAHKKNKMLVNEFELKKLSEENLGYLMQFFMIACAVNGFLEKIDPFNQPDVVNYKEEMKKIISGMEV